MRRLPPWASDVILKPRTKLLAEMISMDPDEGESQMFRVQLLLAYVAAVDPNGPIANDPRRTDDPLIQLMLRLADTSVYSGEEDDLHWNAFFSVLRDESAQDFAHWVTSHFDDFWWRERPTEVLPWVYMDADFDVVERFPHMSNAMQGLEQALSAQVSELALSAQSRTSAPPGSTGRQSKQGGCYIATAVYGSYDAPEVLTLRKFRDERLVTTRVGRAFVRTYYQVSPTLAKHFAPGSVGHGMARTALTQLVRYVGRSQAGSSRSGA